MDLLEELLAIPGVPGREHRIRAAIEAHVRLSELFDDLRTDALGSLIGVRRPRPEAGRSPRPPRRVLIAAHMDCIGFLVSYISPDGYLRLHPVGAFDPRTLSAQRVTVCTETGEDLPGVLAPDGRPLHTATPETLAKVPPLSDFFVDLGLGGDTVREKVRLGDMVVLNGDFRQIGASIVGQGMDNRVGCWALIRALEQLPYHDCEIHAVWSTQEEVGSRGIEPVGFAIEADIGIACDTTVSCNVPGVEPAHHVTEPGKGVAIQIADSSTLADMSLMSDIEQVARENDILCQRSLMVGGGQDGAMIQRSRCGVRTIVLSCPVKYLHTASEMVNRTDLISYRDLISAYIRSL